MADEEHGSDEDRKGRFTKDDKYRTTCESCGRGYHRHFWDAHHVLPYTCFDQITDQFARDCLDLTPFDINDKAAMAGLPQMKAFIIALQNDPAMPKHRPELEKQIHLHRDWGKVTPYKSHEGFTLGFPGNYPVHIPTNFGHVKYNDQVLGHLKEEIFDKLEEQAEDGHPKPQSVKPQLEAAVTKFWGQLTEIASGPGGGGLIGIYLNLKHRYDTAKDGWWKPLCMVHNMTEAPSSPNL